MNLVSFSIIAIFCLVLSNGKLLDESLKERLEDFKKYEKNIEADIESAESFIKSQMPKLSRKNKRFLGSIMEIFKSKSSTASPVYSSQSHYSSYHFDPYPTQHSSFYGPYTTRSAYTYRTNSSSSLISDDPFYKLKNHCAKTYDDFCKQKKHDIYELVKKCEGYDKKTQPESCKDILSIYCYVYLVNDISTCFRKEYDTYKPGVKKYTTSSHPTTKSSTPSIRTISIKFITSAATTRYTTPSTTRWTPSTTLSTTRLTSRWTPSTASTTRSSIKPTIKANNDLVNPFDEPFTTIPNDSEKLKKIGQYCMKLKTKEPNCDKALIMLKEKFKKCEKIPKTDYDCQSFKMNFCGAFTTFPCCADVLAGRTCSGSKTPMRRNLFFM